jgi:hypothetical protein
MKSIVYKNKYPLTLMMMSAGYLFLYLQPTPVFREEHSTWCLFHWLTGLPCPTCGTGRGLICLLHGKFYDAMMFNPLCYVVVMLSLLLLLIMLKDRLKKTNSFTTMMGMKIALVYQIPIWLLLIANEIWNLHKGL